MERWLNIMITITPNPNPVDERLQNVKNIRRKNFAIQRPNSRFLDEKEQFCPDGETDRKPRKGCFWLISGEMASGKAPRAIRQTEKSSLYCPRTPRMMPDTPYDSPHAPALADRIDCDFAKRSADTNLYPSSLDASGCSLRHSPPFPWISQPSS